MLEGCCCVDIGTLASTTKFHTICKCCVYSVWLAVSALTIGVSYDIMKQFSE